jgi:hypothetical protein
MRYLTHAGAAIAAGLLVAAAAKNAAALPVATPAQLGSAEVAAGALERTVLLCDPWRCYWQPGFGGSPYREWRRHYWWGWHRHWRRW